MMTNSEKFKVKHIAILKSNFVFGGKRLSVTRTDVLKVKGLNLSLVSLHYFTTNGTTAVL
jgi:hypothetical protein